MQFDTIIGQPINKLCVSGYINIYNRDGRQENISISLKNTWGNNMAKLGKPLKDFKGANKLDTAW